MILFTSLFLSYSKKYLSTLCILLLIYFTGEILSQSTSPTLQATMVKTLERLPTLLPIGCLLATIQMLSVLKRNGELHALLSLGVSYKQILSPLLCVSLISSLLLFISTEYILPNLSSEKDNTKQNISSITTRDNTLIIYSYHTKDTLHLGYLMKDEFMYSFEKCLLSPGKVDLCNGCKYSCNDQGIVLDSFFKEISVFSIDCYKAIKNTLLEAQKQNSINIISTAASSLSSNLSISVLYQRLISYFSLPIITLIVFFSLSGYSRNSNTTRTYALCSIVYLAYYALYQGILALIQSGGLAPFFCFVPLFGVMAIAAIVRVGLKHKGH